MAALLKAAQIRFCRLFCIHTHSYTASHSSIFYHSSELYTEQKESGFWNDLFYETPAFQTNVIVFFLLIIQIDMYVYYI